MLDWWAGGIAVATEHAAVARLGLDSLLAARAVEVILTAVFGHRQLAALAAERAGQGRLENDICHMRVSHSSRHLQPSPHPIRRPARPSGPSR